MGISGEDPRVRRDVGQALNKVIDKENSDLSRRSMTDREINALRTGQTQELVENKLIEKGYSQQAAKRAVEETAKTFIT